MLSSSGCLISFLCLVVAVCHAQVVAALSNETVSFSFTFTDENNSTADTASDPLTETVSLHASASRTLSPSASLPSEGGYLQWELAPQQYAPEGYVPSFVDTDLRKRSFTFRGRIAHDSFDAEAYKEHFVNVTILRPLLRQARGLENRRDKGEVLRQSSFYFNGSAFAITFFQDDFFELRQNELVNFQFHRNLTVSKRTIQNELQVEIISKVYPRNDAMVSLVAVTGGISAVMHLALGVPGMHEVQGLVMVGSMTCLDKSVATFTDGTDIILSPLPFGDSPHGKLGGNIALTIYIFLLMVSSMTIIRRNVLNISKIETEERCLFPSVPISIVVLSFPGYVFFSVQFLGAIIGGGLTVLMILVVILYGAGLYYVTVYVRSREDFQQMVFVPMHEDATTCVSWFLYPTGRWNPQRANRMYRSFIGEYGAHYWWLPYTPFAVGGVMALVAGVQPSSPNTCRGQFASLALVFGISGIYYLRVRPYRYLLHNLLSALSCIVLIIFTGASAANDERTEDVSRNVIYLFLGAIVLRTAAVIVTMHWEFKKNKEAERNAATYSFPGTEAPMVDTEGSDVTDSDSEF